MRAVVLLFLGLVLAPAAVLACCSVLWIGEWHASARQSLTRAGSRYAEEEAERLTAALHEAAGRAVREGVAAHVGSDSELRYTAAPPSPRASEEAADPGELRLYRLSLQGGESFAAARDWERALDAYAFYLPRLRTPALRARLLDGAARAAGALERNALAAGLRRQVMETAPGTRGEEGLPLDLVAACRELERNPPDAAALRARALAALERDRLQLGTALLKRLAAAIAPGDRELSRHIEAREALEAAARAHPGVLGSTEAVWDDAGLLFARHEPSGDGSTIRSLSFAPFERPGLRWDIVPPNRTDDPAWASTHEVRLGPGGPLVGRIAVPGLSPEEKRLLRTWRNGLLALVAFLFLGTAGGGLALVLFLRRERQLAALRRRLLANVSHELKTPVTSIRMFAEMMAAGRHDAVQVGRFSEHLKRETARLSQLLENLLDLARPERAGEQLPREPVAIAGLVRDLAEAFAYRAHEAGVAFTAAGADADADEPNEGLTLSTHAAAVERIVQNLLDNALKYRRAAGASIALTLRRDGEWACIEVADNGPGIARRDRERIFEEFYRVRYDDYAVKGSGLGLSIARKLARQLGGDVTCHSREGEGSRFTLRLPLEDGTAGKEAA